jgi:hypothetical protein
LKAIYANLAAGTAVNVKDLMTPALVVPSSMSASALLEKFKETSKHVALVADEFGGLIGLVSFARHHGGDHWRIAVGGRNGPGRGPAAVMTGRGWWME